MEEQKSLKDLTVDQLNELVITNANGLTERLGRKVHGLLLNTAGMNKTDGDWVVGYYYEPSLYQKMTILDHVDKDKILKGFQLLEANIIKEHSDPRLINKENAANHNVIIGASLAVVGSAIDFSINQVTDLKKNGA